MGIESDWLREASAAFAGEAVLYLRTVGGFARAPRRFLSGWAAGTVRAQNPLGFMATTLAVTTVLQLLRDSLPGATASQQGTGTVWDAALTALGPYVHYFALGLLSHAVLRLMRTRGHVIASTAGSLYAGGVALLTLQAVYLLAALKFPALRKAGDVVVSDRLALLAAVVAFGGALLWFLYLLVRALAALHHTSAWRPAVAAAVALLASALFFGSFKPPGSYGLCPALKVGRSASGRWSVSLALSLT